MEDALVAHGEVPGEPLPAPRAGAGLPEPPVSLLLLLVARLGGVSSPGWEGHLAQAGVAEGGEGGLLAALPAPAQQSDSNQD